MSKDIKKALEHCVDWDCGNCPNRDELGSGETVCRGRLLPEVLGYVSDLEAKLAESKKQCQQCKHLNKKIELNIKNKLMSELAEKDKTIANIIEDSKTSKELLKKQLTEKNKEIEKLNACVDFYKSYSVSFQEKVIDELEKVKEHFINIKTPTLGVIRRAEMVMYIDNQIEKLTHQHKDK